MRLDATTVPGLESTVIGEMLRYGLVGVIAVIFALVIRYLYRENRDDRVKREAVHEAERKVWSSEREMLKADNARCIEACKTERELLRADYERRNKEAVEGYMHQFTVERDAARKREDDLRHDTDAFVASIADKAKVSDEAMVAMLQKLLASIIK